MKILYKLKNYKFLIYLNLITMFLFNINYNLYLIISFINTLLYILFSIIMENDIIKLSKENYNKNINETLKFYNFIDYMVLPYTIALISLKYNVLLNIIIVLWHMSILLKLNILKFFK